MPKKNSTEIVVVLDRSGSMISVKEDMEGGFDTLIAEQLKIPGECHVTLFQFDNMFEEVYTHRPLKAVPHLLLSPRGGTALWDAVGAAVDKMGQRLAELPDRERPDRVLFVIITDGHENASHKYALWQVQERIKHQQDKYSWGFIYLGSALTAVQDAEAMGVYAVANFVPSTGGIRGMTASINNVASAYRGSSVVMDAQQLRAAMPKNIPPTQTVVGHVEVAPKP